jgi:hypothetical protein
MLFPALAVGLHHGGIHKRLEESGDDEKRNHELH